MNRDNAYYIERLKREGRDDLVARIRSREISVYAACVKAGLRRIKTTESRAEQLSYHWQRASAPERRRFVAENLKSLGPIVGILVKKLMASQEKVESPSE